MLELYLLIVFLAGVFHGLVGFGFGLVCMSVLPYFIPVQVAVVVVAAVRTVPVFTLLVELRKHVAWRQVAPLLCGALIGVPFGVWFLRTASATSVRLTLGVILVGYASWALRSRGPQEPRDLARGWGLLAGSVGGVLGGAFNTGGPPVVAFATIVAWPRDVLRASLSSYFALVMTFQLCLFVAEGLLTIDLLRVQLLGIPIAVLGARVGSFFAKRVPQERFRRGLLILIWVLGASFLSRTLYGMFAA